MLHFIQIIQKRRGSAPESGNRGKNGAIVQKLSVAFIGAMCILLSACSSPEKDGIKAAKMWNEIIKKQNAIWKDQLEREIEACELYIAKFDSYAFTTHVDAQKKLEESLGSLTPEADQKFREEAEKKYREAHDKLQSKYATDEEDMKKFNYARDHYPEERLGGDKELSDLRNKRDACSNKAKSLINSIPR